MSKRPSTRRPKVSRSASRPATIAPVQAGILHEVAKQADIDRAVKDVFAAFRRGGAPYLRTLQGVSRKRMVFWQPEHKVWIADASEDMWESYIWIPYGVDNPVTNTSKLEMAVQTGLNFVDRPGDCVARIATDGRRRYLCHTGKLGGNQMGIRKEDFLKQSRAEMGTIYRTTGDDESVVVLTCLDEPETIVPNLAAFAAAAAAYREKVRARNPKAVIPRLNPVRVGQQQHAASLATSASAPSPLRELDPSSAVDERVIPAQQERIVKVEHNETVRQLREKIEVHGLPCKEGEKFLAESQGHDLVIGRLESPAVHFEVKTDTRSQSVFTAVGQLLVLNHRYPSSIRVAVLPRPVKDTDRAALKSLGIEILEYSVYEGNRAFHGLDDLLMSVKLRGEQKQGSS